MDGYSQSEPDQPPGSASLAAVSEVTGTFDAFSDDFSDAFSQALEQTTSFVETTFGREIERQQLYYHGFDHVNGVARRARLIFDTVVGYYEGACLKPPRQDTVISWERQRDLLQLCAIAHDMLQIFSPQPSLHAPRYRKTGHSEKATIETLLNFIHELNQAAVSSTHSKEFLFSSADVAIIREAIEATICEHDSIDGAIYQPLLYSCSHDEAPISLVAQSIALADIGTLGIEGIAAYRTEGRLLLLEENLDIIEFVQHESAFDAPFRENLRQRLLKRARFEVSFARGRLTRLDQELKGLPEGAIACLKSDVFKYMTSETILTLEKTTPTSETTSLTELLDYFHITEMYERRE